MLYKSIYKSPLGMLTLISDGDTLNYILFENDRFYENIKLKAEELDLKIFSQTKNWLDKYFNGEKPNIDDIKIKLKGTPFQIRVWNVLKNISYGQTVTYKELANKLSKPKSYRAVGYAVGHNPLPIIIPCHRVVGTDGSLTGYSGGIKNKVSLLINEQNDMSKYFIPKNTKRCRWCSLDNPLYVKYHDLEWGVPNFDDKYLFEMLILESFQAGLSWECILNKREYFKEAYDNFDIDKVIKYDENKINELLSNSKIIRNKLKVKASINNAKIFKNIQDEYGSFYNYLITFTNYKIICEVGKTTNFLSDVISKDLIKKGMKFTGSTIIYSYLQATGFIYSHDKECFMYKNN